jgi:predicted acetyltransferase
VGPAAQERLRLGAGLNPLDAARAAPAHLGTVTPLLRRAADDDLPAIAVTDGRAFGFHHSATDVEDFRPLFEPRRFVLACDPADGAIVGLGGSFPFDLTLPGGAVMAIEGVTWVAVSATHRRRGILRAMMTDLHRGYVDGGVAVSLLTASEGGIYGRFGYGPATTERLVTIDRRRAQFRPGTPDPGGVRYVDTETARKAAPEIHRRWCAVNPGALSRSDPWWDNALLDREHRRWGGSALFHLVHPDGYASYRTGDGTCRVIDFFAATDEAHVALWRVLLGIDLTATVTARDVPLDDPLPFLLTDPRQVATTGLPDGVWARILDVPAALGARCYSAEIDVVLTVHDEFLDRGGRFRLRGGPEGATCEPTGAAADAEIEIRALGSLLLGGHRAHTLARAGLLSTLGPGVLARLDAAFVAGREPRFGTHF